MKKLKDPYVLYFLSFIVLIPGLLVSRVLFEFVYAVFLFPIQGDEMVLNETVLSFSPLFLAAGIAYLANVYFRKKVQLEKNNWESWTIMLFHYFVSMLGFALLFDHYTGILY